MEMFLLEQIGQVLILVLWQSLLLSSLLKRFANEKLTTNLIVHVAR